MKFKKIFFIATIILLIICNSEISAFAMNTGFSTNDMNSKDKDAFLSNIKLSLVTYEPQKNTIQCFDVNDSGLIAIGSETSDNKYISIYNSSGKFKYGYVFNCNQSFGVEWDNSTLIVYFVRSNVAASFDSSGNNIEMKIIEDNIQNNSYWNHSVFAKERIINNSKYTIKNNIGVLNIFATSYSLLMKTDTNGKETKIYDVSGTQIQQITLIIIEVIVFAMLAIVIIVGQFLRAKKNITKKRGSSVS